MNSALSKTLSLLVLILVGYLLQKRIASTDKKGGIKEIILSVALPAMIFISIQKISFEVQMVLIPLMALAFNFILFFLADFFAPIFQIDKGSSAFRTFKMLVPSLAPGLSCFPFLLEYFGEEALAGAALADIGNKFFVLIVLYLVGMRWYYQTHNVQAGNSTQKVLSLLRAMIKEPVNFAIFLGILLLALGINYDRFPLFLRMSVDRLSLIMTPLILLFIGISVRSKWSQVKTIFSMLLCKSAIGFLLSGLLIVAFGITDPIMVMLVILFPQSSFSFWPYAHMCAIDSMESDTETSRRKTFDLEYAMNILAFSLPFSTMLILTLCTFSDAVVSTPSFPFVLAAIFMGIALLKPYLRFVHRGIVFKTSRKSEAVEH